MALVRERFRLPAKKTTANDTSHCGAERWSTSVDAKFILDHHLEVLAVGFYQHGVCFSCESGRGSILNGSPEANAGGVELDTALVELAAVTVECFLIVGSVASPRFAIPGASKPSSLSRHRFP